MRFYLDVCLQHSLILATLIDNFSSVRCELLMYSECSCHWVSLSHLQAVIDASQHYPAQFGGCHKRTPAHWLYVAYSQYEHHIGKTKHNSLKLMGHL